MGERSDRSASEIWREASGTRDEAWEPERWEADVDVPGPRRTRAGAPADGRRPPRPLPAAVQAELASTAGTKAAPRIGERLSMAARAFERDRFQEARTILARLADQAPGAASVRELYGLTLYRLQQWSQAVRELTAAYELSGSFEQHAALADAHRALGHHAEVERLWDELREASPDAATVVEGRIVLAGSHADRGDLRTAIKTLEGGKLSSRNPEDHHLRLWYALADLYERAGELPRARDLFERIARNDPDFVDVLQRRRNLS